MEVAVVEGKWVEKESEAGSSGDVESGGKEGEEESEGGIGNPTLSPIFFAWRKPGGRKEGRNEGRKEGRKKGCVDVSSPPMGGSKKREGRNGRTLCLK